MIGYLKNFTIGFFTGYLFALIIAYLIQMVKSGFNFANLDVSEIFISLIFGWIVGLINGTICVKGIDLYRLSIGLFSGIAVFYAVLLIIIY